DNQAVCETVVAKSGQCQCRSAHAVAHIEGKAVVVGRVAGNKRSTIKFKNAERVGHQQTVHFDEAGVEDIGSPADIHEGAVAAIGGEQGATVHRDSII